MKWLITEHSVDDGEDQSTGKANPWDMPDIDDKGWTGADSFKRLGDTGKKQTLVTIDSGFNHTAKKLLHWEDFVDHSKKPIDPNGHRTHVAGDALKMAPDADLIALPVMNEKGQGRISDILHGVQWVVDNGKKFGVKVVNMFSVTILTEPRSAWIPTMLLLQNWKRWGF